MNDKETILMLEAQIRRFQVTLKDPLAEMARLHAEIARLTAVIRRLESRDDIRRVVRVVRHECKPCDDDDYHDETGLALRGASWYGGPV